MFALSLVFVQCIVNAIFAKSGESNFIFRVQWVTDSYNTL